MHTNTLLEYLKLSQVERNKYSSMSHHSKDISLEGYMKKRGHRTWGDRYFILNDHVLYYFLKKTDAVCNLLINYKIISDFDIILGIQREIYFKT